MPDLRAGIIAAPLGPVDANVPIGSMAERPAPEDAEGKYYYVNDSSPKLLFFSDGITWVPVTTDPVAQSWDGATNDNILPSTQLISGYGTPPAANSCACTQSYGGGYEGWRALNGVTGDSWYTGQPGSGCLAYYYGEGNAKKINKYRFQFPNKDNYASSWLIQKPAEGVSSPDAAIDAHWVAIHQVASYTGVAVNGDWSQWFTFVVYDAFTAIRFRPITVPQAIQISEIQFIEDTRS